MKPLSRDAASPSGFLGCEPVSSSHEIQINKDSPEGGPGWIGGSVVTAVLPLTGWVKAQFGISTAQQQPATSRQGANPAFLVSFFSSKTEVSSLPLSFSAQAQLPSGPFGRLAGHEACPGSLGFKGKAVLAFANLFPQLHGGQCLSTEMVKTECSFFALYSRLLYTP